MGVPPPLPLLHRGRGGGGGGAEAPPCATHALRPSGSRLSLPRPTLLQPLHHPNRAPPCSALILDVALMELQDATTCDLVTVGDRFEPMEQATAFPPGFNNSALLAA